MRVLLLWGGVALLVLVVADASVRDPGADLQGTQDEFTAAIMRNKRQTEAKRKPKPKPKPRTCPGCFSGINSMTEAVKRKRREDGTVAETQGSPFEAEIVMGRSRRQETNTEKTKPKRHRPCTGCFSAVANLEIQSRGSPFEAEIVRGRSRRHATDAKKTKPKRIRPCTGCFSAVGRPERQKRDVQTAGRVEETPSRKHVEISGRGKRRRCPGCFSAISGRVISPTAMIWREEIKFEEDRPAGGFNVFEMLQRPKQFPEADITAMQEEPFGSFR
ncbi:uncharacterized protein LOC142487984 isoform X2 [Ascaphus truei]|uniref:uncharacterized protein LOC142487984 isoform X2 n=1 Tax=Ascaphus truei TaxID=8439 RepID=UPI003F59024F